jgi:predicted ArsR family transcriptional regulator
MEKTRERILEYLHDHPGATCGDLGRYLELTSANIRYHLNLLIKSGQVQISGKRQGGGAGRPVLLYNLSSESLGESLQELLGVTLESILDLDDYEEILELIAQRYASKKEIIPGNLISRYNQVIAYLNDLGYHASWQAYAAGPGVDLRHCPYRSMPLLYPVLCQIDQLIISDLFQTELHLVKRRSFSTNPFSTCQFRPPAPGEE